MSCNAKLLLYSTCNCACTMMFSEIVLRQCYVHIAFSVLLILLSTVENVMVVLSVRV